MPQVNYLPLFRAMYPLTAPYQKPGGVTVSTTLPGNAVPNPGRVSVQAEPAAAAQPADNHKSKK